MKKWKKILNAAIAVSVSVMCTVSTVMAASVDLNAVYGISSNGLEGWPQGPEISCNTGILMEAETGAVLYDKGADELRYPASITKLMTLLVAVENSSLDEEVTFTETGVRDVTPDSGNIGMQLGEVMTMEDCLYAMIIYSANEVSAQIAEHVGGTEQNFIDMMNERAAQIGCTNTHFTNASGLPDTNQYTTARDMALIFREGLNNEIYREILNTPTYVIPATNKNSEERKLHTHHPLFAEESGLYYPGCIGGKSGMTNDAGHTLVTGVEQNGVTYITVVLRAADLSQACVDSRQLFDYGFQNFRKEEYKNGSVMLPNTMTTDQIEEKETDSEDGKIYQFYVSGQLMGAASVPEPTEAPVPTVTEKEPLEEVGSADEEPLYQQESLAEESGVESETEKKTGKLTHMTKILLIVMGVMIVLLVILLAALHHKNKKKKRKKRR